MFPWMQRSVQRPEQRQSQQRQSGQRQREAAEETERYEQRCHRHIHHHYHHMMMEMPRQREMGMYMDDCDDYMDWDYADDSDDYDQEYLGEEYWDQKKEIVMPIEEEEKEMMLPGRQRQMYENRRSPSCYPRHRRYNPHYHHMCPGHPIRHRDC